MVAPRNACAPRSFEGRHGLRFVAHGGHLPAQRASLSRLTALRSVQRSDVSLAGAMAVGASTNQLRSFRRSIDEALLMLTFSFGQKIAKRIDVIAETVHQFAPYGTHFCHYRIIRGTVHGASNSSGVQTIGGS